VHGRRCIQGLCRKGRAGGIVHAYSVALQLDRIGQPEAVASVHFEVHWDLVMAAPCKRADGFEQGRRPRSYLAIWWGSAKAR
jgi:hypothetical protein